MAGLGAGRSSGMLVLWLMSQIFMGCHNECNPERLGFAWIAIHNERDMRATFSMAMAQ